MQERGCRKPWAQEGKGLTQPGSKAGEAPCSGSQAENISPWCLVPART